MCPDKTLLSAYYDGEVSSPWKEQIQEHLEECLSCRALVEGFAAQSEQLHSLPEPVLSSDFSDIQRMIRQRHTVHDSTPAWRSSGWSGIPVAAAAAAVLAFFFGFLSAGNVSPSASYMAPPIAVSEGWSIPAGDLMVPGEDINQLLSYLEPSDSQLFTQETSMELPVDMNFDIYGDSQLMKTASLDGSGFR